MLSELAVCVCCGAWSTPSAVRACCMCVLWCLEHTWCCQSLLYMCVMVLGAHLVLSELAVCVCYGAWSTPGAIRACCMCVLWCLEHTWCYQSLLYVCVVVLGAWCYQSLLYVCVVVLGAHLVLLELAVCVCYGAWSLVLSELAVCVCCGAWSTPGAVRACCMCVLWCLEHTWCYQSLLYVCVVVLGAHLVLICVGYMRVLCQCLLHLAYVCVGYMYSGVLGM